MEYILKVPDQEREFIQRLLQAFAFVELIPTTKPARKAKPKDETEYLLSSPANAKALLAAIERSRNGQFVEHDLIEPQPMRVGWDETAWEHYVQWQDLDAKTVRKINALVKECQRTPFTGTGKPEALKGNLRGHWSRRINQEHRLVYRIEADWLIIVQCRFHYDDK